MYLSGIFCFLSYYQKKAKEAGKKPVFVLLPFSLAFFIYYIPQKILCRA